VAFFYGFRAYITGAISLARDHFDAVLAEDVSDFYTAVALHLRANCDRGTVTKSTIEMLERSIRLSRDPRLRLTTNEVMARHSLTMALLRLHQAGSPLPVGGGTPLIRAQSLARQNEERARQLNDKGLMAWCIRIRASVDWAVLLASSFGVGLPIDAVIASRKLLDDLSEAMNISDANDDLETWLYAANERALILRDLGDFETAIEQLEYAYGRVKGFLDAPAPVDNLLKTSRSILTSRRFIAEKRSTLQVRVSELVENLESQVAYLPRKR
jgi:hypothetical protein